MSSEEMLEAFVSLKEAPVLVTYTTMIAESRHATGRWLPGLPVTLGYTWPPQEPNPLPVITLAKVDCSHYSFLRTGDGAELVVSINQSEVAPLLDPGMYLVAHAVITASGREFTGDVLARGDDPVSAPPPYDWKGTVALGGAVAHDNAIHFIRTVTAWRQRQENGFR
jgi:hypothetical protein